MDSPNPYESPRVYGRLIPRRTRSPWTGPLLTLSLLFFCLAFITGSFTAAEGGLIVVVIAMFFGMLGVGCLATSFLLFRRGRYAKPGWETEPGTNIPKAR